MKLFAPDYYKEFKCIADKCLHSCCRGWEIDIDEESLRRWAYVKGEIGDRIRKKTVIEEDGTAHFLLDEEENCPFLNKDGLCDMILAMGEDSLCQICTDHPRYRNYWSDRIEIGLGMACEEAARLIITKKEKTELVLIDEYESEEDEALSPEEIDLLDLRSDIFDILCDRSISTDERIVKMLDFCCIEKKKDFVFDGTAVDDVAGEQLCVYLLYRNLADALYDGRLLERIYFVADNYRKIRNSWAKDGFVNLETAREFSQKIEYDTDTWGE